MITGFSFLYGERFGRSKKTFFAFFEIVLYIALYHIYNYNPQLP